MNREREGPKIASCDPPGVARRNRYFRGKLLTASDYTTEQRYHIERRRLINRAIHGWGLISGFAVESSEGRLRVSPGLAFDREGRELIACAEVILAGEADLFWLDDGIGPAGGDSRPAGDYWLSAHYAERGIDGVRIDDGYGEGLCEANRICETVAFSLARHHASGKDQEAEEAVPDFDPCRTARLVRIRGVDVDLDAPVTLARVTVGFGSSGDLAFVGLDETYRPRRLARSAPTPTDPEPPSPARARTGGGLKQPVVRTVVPHKPTGGPDAEGDNT
jgi:hypothetical protein